MAAECSGCRMERIFRVQTVKLVGPCRIKFYIAREKKKSKKKVTTTMQNVWARSEKKGDGVQVK